MTCLILTLGSTSTAIKLAGNWICDIRKLLLLLLKVLLGSGRGVGLEPVSGLLNGIQDLHLLVKCSNAQSFGKE